MTFVLSKPKSRSKSVIHSHRSNHPAEEFFDSDSDFDLDLTKHR